MTDLSLHCELVTITHENPCQVMQTKVMFYLIIFALGTLARELSSESTEDWSNWPWLQIMA